MLLSLLPQGIITMAAMSESGTASDPYIITTATELGTIGNYGAATYFKLGSDIAVGSNFSTVDTFYGVRDDNGKTITGVNLTAKVNSDLSITSTGRLINTVDASGIIYNLTVDSPKLKVDYTNVATTSGNCYLNSGVFVNKNKGTLNNISIVNANMDTTLPSGCPLLVRNFEVLANINSVYILNSSLSGTMTIPGSYDMGAVVNTNTSTGTIANVVSNVNIQLNSAGYHKYATDTSCGVSFWVYL